MPQIIEVSKEFRHQDDGRTRRDTREYGFSFFKMLEGGDSYDPPPLFLQELGRDICRVLGHEPPSEFNNIILSYYEKGFYLEPHVDSDLYFSERVYGIIIINRSQVASSSRESASVQSSVEVS